MATLSPGDKIRLVHLPRKAAISRAQTAAQARLQPPNENRRVDDHVEARANQPAVRQGRKSHLPVTRCRISIQMWLDRPNCMGARIRSRARWDPKTLPHPPREAAAASYRIFQSMPRSLQKIPVVEPSGSPSTGVRRRTLNRSAPHRPEKGRAGSYSSFPGQEQSHDKRHRVPPPGETSLRHHVLGNHLQKHQISLYR